MITTDQQERRARSEAYCQQYKVPTYKGALYTPSEAATELQELDEVVDRVLALCYIGLKSEGLKPELLANYDKKYKVSEKFSEEEEEYAANPQATEQQNFDANWRYESMHVLLWVLGFVEQLAFPKDICDVATDINTVLTRTEAQLREQAKLRSKTEILDQTDIALRLHWACQDAFNKDIEEPADLETSVVFERIYAFYWLINQNPEEDWDDITIKF